MNVGNEPRNPVLQGQHIYLGILDQEDLVQLAKMDNDLETATYLYGYGRVSTVEEKVAFYEALLKDNKRNLIFGIFCPDNQLIGVVWLEKINHQTKTASLSIAIFDRSRRGKGFGTEAVKLISAYGAYHLDLFNIDLKVFAFNTSAIRAYEKAGFRIIGRRTGRISLGGQRYDEVWMEITQPEIDTSALHRQLLQLSSKK